MKNENLKFFKRAIEEGLSLKFDEIAEKVKETELPEPSIEHKINMNRILREASGGSFTPYPEADEQH